MSLGKLLGSPKAHLDAIPVDVLALSEKVGTEKFALPPAQLSVQKGSIPVFKNQNLTVGAKAMPTVQIHPYDYEARAFDSPGSAAGFRAAEGKRFAELTLDGGFSVEGQASGQPEPFLSLSLGLKSGADLKYRHLLPVSAGQTRIEALQSLVNRSRLPQVAKLQDLESGEVHELTAQVFLDLNAKARIGGDTSFIGNLFSELPSEVQAHAQYGVEAALGLALYEKMKISAGKALLLNKDQDWVRLRIQRESQRRLTLGARFALEVQYNLTTGLESLLEHALDFLPFPRFIETLKNVRDIAGEFGETDWETVKKALSKQMGKEVTELLGDAGWLDWTKDEVASFVKLSKEVVDAYDRLEERLGNLWDSLLGKAALGAGSDARNLLERLSQLDPLHPETLVQDEQQRKLIAAVEILSGQSLEEILLASGASPALKEVKALAAAALYFLDTVPKDFLTKLLSFTERTSIDKAITWLKDNATSEAQLCNVADTYVQKLVEKLAGRALIKIRAEDVKKIQKWAQKIHKILAAPDDNLRRQINRLKGQAGLSVAVEIDRVSRTTALLDLEFDPKDPGLCCAVENLASGDLGAVLADLPAVDKEGTEKDEEEDSLPYQIRECVFTSQRVRTSSSSLFFSWLGWTKGSKRRIEESTVRVLPTLRREAVYSGAAVLSSEGLGAPTSSAVWLISRAEGAGTKLEEPYEKLLSRELRLTCSREDDNTTPAELDGLGTLLTDLGFAKSKAEPRAAVFAHGAEKKATRFSIDVRLPDKAVDSFFRGFGGADAQETWFFDLLNALHRCFNEELVSDKVNIGKMRPTGAVLASALLDQGVHEAWLKGWQDLNDMARTTSVTLCIGGENVTFELADDVNGTAVWKTLVPLPKSRIHADSSLKLLRKLEPKLDGVLTPRNLNILTRDAAKALNAFQLRLVDWANPMLGIWAVISRLSRCDKDALGQATGLATLRWQDDQGNWPAGNIQTWQLSPGAMVHDRTSGKGIFPIVK